MTIVRTYIARPGSHLSNADASRIGKFLDRTFGEGIFTPEQVVEAAQPAKSPIHGDFTWEDSEAATKYRLYEARRMIGAVMLVEERESEQLTSRAYHHVITRNFPERKSGYVGERVVWASPELSGQVIERAKRELTAWNARYSAYSGLREWAVEELKSSIIAESV